MVGVIVIAVIVECIQVVAAVRGERDIAGLAPTVVPVGAGIAVGVLPDKDHVGPVAGGDRRAVDRTLDLGHDVGPAVAVAAIEIGTDFRAGFQEVGAAEIGVQHLAAGVGAAQPTAPGAVDALGQDDAGKAGNGVGSLGAAEALGAGGGTVRQNRPGALRQRDRLVPARVVENDGNLAPLAGRTVGHPVGDAVVVRALQRVLLVLIHRVGEGREALADGDQALVEVGAGPVGLADVPVDGVDGVVRVIAVVIAALASGKLRAGHLELHTLGRHQDGLGQAELLQVGLGGSAGVGAVGGAAVGFDDLVPKDQIVVGVGIGDGLGSVGEPTVVGVQAAPDRIGLVAVGIALNPARRIAVGVALDGVAHPVAEQADAGVQAEGLGAVLGRAVGDAGVAAGPGLAVHQDLPAFAAVQLVQIRADQIHGLHVVAAHEVEAEAVDVILGGPIVDGLDHVLPEHQLVGGGDVATAGAVVPGGGAGHPEVVAGNGVVEGVVVEQTGAPFVGIHVIGVVVDHVHDHGDARLVEGLDHLLELGDPGVAVIGVRGVGALGYVVVDGIVAPVAVGGVVGDSLIHGAEVVSRQQVDRVDAHLLEIIDAGGDLAGGAVQRGAVLGEGQVLAPVLLGDAGRGGDGEVADMHLPDNGVGALVQQDVGIVLPALGIGGVQIDDHGAVAVDAGGLGIDVAGLIGLAAGGDQVGIVDILVVPVQLQGPNAGAGVPGHRVRAENPGPFLLVRAGAVKPHLNPCRVGGPDLPGGGGRRIVRAEPLGAVSTGCVVFQIIYVVISVDAGGCGGRGQHGDHKHDAQEERSEFLELHLHSPFQFFAGIMVGLLNP